LPRKPCILPQANSASSVGMTKMSGQAMTRSRYAASSGVAGPGASVQAAGTQIAKHINMARTSFLLV